MLFKYEVILVKGFLDVQRLPTPCQAFSLKETFKITPHPNKKIIIKRYKLMCNKETSGDRNIIKCSFR